ncbi:hypothetical protein ACIRD2_02310 [Streptomyces sp. NPDC093595]|uniref:hypothetical protein n=1 Tax=Streptomyces sp. NPDC093595 TaxID=3366045 RepID=UPI003807B6EC
MTQTGLSETLAELTTEDISVDEEGRVSVANPEIARKISQAVVAAAPGGPTNGSACQPNASSCKPNASSCRPT